MYYLDLFSGIGGFALGAYNAGWRFERHYFSEIDPWCCRLYARRFPDAVPLGDIRSIRFVRHSIGTRQLQSAWRFENGGGWTRDTGEEWILTGGFPCQDISVAGKGAGIGGARSGLWFEYARLIGEIRPRYAIMENVGALTRRGLDRVLGSLAEIGYDAEWSDIRASDVGAPHRRERIWIVAYPQERGPGRSESGNETGFTWSWRHGANGCDSISPGLAQRKSEPSDDGAQLTPAVGTDWWSVEPDVGRVAHGVSQRVDRLRGLGNAIVPQIAEMIFRELK